MGVGGWGEGKKEEQILEGPTELAGAGYGSGGRPHGAPGGEESPTCQHLLTSSLPLVSLPVGCHVPLLLGCYLSLPGGP